MLVAHLHQIKMTGSLSDPGAKPKKVYAVFSLLVADPAEGSADPDGKMGKVYVFYSFPLNQDDRILPKDPRILPKNKEGLSDLVIFDLTPRCYYNTKLKSG